MPKLPRVTGQQVIKALRKIGYEVVRQRGSHVTLVNRESGTVAVVPIHGNKELPPGTLAGILRGAGLTGDDLGRLLG